MMVRFMRLVGRLVVDHPGLVTALSLGPDLVLVCQHPQPAHRHRPDRSVWQSRSAMASREPDRQRAGLWQPALRADRGPGGRNGHHRRDGGNGRPSHRRHAMPAGCSSRRAAACRKKNCSTWCGSLPGTFRHSSCPSKRKISNDGWIRNRFIKPFAAPAPNWSRRFPSLGTNYFVADPLGLMEVAAHNSQGFSQFASFDLTWGAGNRFFSKDHKALLIIAEPRQSAVDYKFAEQVVQWTREHIQST